MGRILGTIVVLVLVAFGVAWAFGLVELDQTQRAELPTVEVNGGTLPEFDADVADVDVGTRNEVVEVPTVDVDRPGE